MNPNRRGQRAQGARLLLSGMGSFSVGAWGSSVFHGTAADLLLGSGAAVVGMTIAWWPDIRRSIAVWRRRHSLRTIVRRRLVQTTAHGLAMTAIFIGGRSRAWRSREYLANLAGYDTRPGPPPWGQIRHAAGLIRGALVMRAGDLARLLVRLLDWTLAMPRTEWLVATLTLLSAIYFLRAGGFSGFMHSLGNVLAVALLIGPAVWLRRTRDVPPAQRRKGSNHQGDTSDN
jgi:hypothetical protein